MTDIWPAHGLPGGSREHLRELLRQEPVRRALQAALQQELRAPSYQPGDTFEVTAWREGRRAVLQELIRLSEHDA